MSNVYCILRMLQLQQGRSYASLLRLPATHKRECRRLLTQVYFRKLAQNSSPVVKARALCSQAPESAPNKDHKEEKVVIGEGTWEEVYQGVLSTQIKLVKMFSLSTSVICLTLQPLLLQELGGINLGYLIVVGAFAGFFTFATPVLIHWISKKYVIKLEYDRENDMYSATTISFFVKEQKLNFKVDDVQVPDLPGMFTTFFVKGKAVFLDPNHFNDVDHYSRLMGYDKPINYRLMTPKEESKDN